MNIGLFNDHPILKLGTKVYRKQILRYGEFVDPNDPRKKMKFDRQYGDELIKNFQKGVFDQVPVQLTHEENPINNVGNILGLEHTPDGTGLDALLAVTDDQVSEKIDTKDPMGNSIIKGVSVGIQENYRDKETGSLIGKVLRHLAIVTHPYIKGMKPFEPVFLGDEEKYHYFEENNMSVSMEDVLKFLNDNGIKVNSLDDLKKPNITVNADIEGAVKRVLGDSLQLDGKSIVDVVKGLADTIEKQNQTNISLQNSNKELADKLARNEAEQAVAKLVREGRILPAEKDGMTKLYLSDSNLFNELVKDRPVLVKLGEQITSDDVNIPGKNKNLSNDDVKSKIDEYADIYQKQVVGGPHK